MKTASEIANFFLKYASERGDLVTNLKLQKIVYYAQAWHLALWGKPFFNEDFEAWVHGPVIPSLYQKFKRYGWRPIPVKKEIEVPKFESLPNRLLEEVYVKYGALEAFQLEMLTHQEDPWRIARGNLAPDVSCDNIISKDSIQKYYSNVQKA